MMVGLRALFWRRSPATSAGSPNQAVTGVLWAAVSQASRVVIQFATLAILSRLLPPIDFGIVAMAGVVTTFATLIRDMGTASAVIQRKELSDGLLDTVFWFNVCIGLLIAASIALLALPIARTFQEPRLVGVLLVLALSFPISSTAAVHQALLERGLVFQTLARIEITSSLFALGVAIIAGLSGLGVYSLVLNAMAAVVLSTLQLWGASRWRPARRWSHEQFRALWGFSGNLASFQILNYFARNADTILVGRFLGAADLAWYNTGYKIMLFPLTSLSAVVSRVLFPVLSRRQSDPVAFGSLYLNATTGIALVTAPLMAGIWALRTPFVALLLGDRWLSVADVLAWLAPVGLVQSVGTTVGLIYMGTGKTNIMMRWGTFSSLITVAAICIGLRWGYLGVARCYAIASLALAYPSFVVGLRLIDLKFTDLVKSVGLPVLVALAMAAFIAMLDNYCFETQNPLVRMSVLAPIALLFYGGVGWLVMRAQVTSLLQQIRGPRPA
jgi:O-antigen/teichoic acid export membrane protein